MRRPNLAFILYERWPKASKLLLEYAEQSEISLKKLNVKKAKRLLTDGNEYVAIFIFIFIPLLSEFKFV